MAESALSMTLSALAATLSILVKAGSSFFTPSSNVFAALLKLATALLRSALVSSLSVFSSSRVSDVVEVLEGLLEVLRGRVGEHALVHLLQGFPQILHGGADVLQGDFDLLADLLGACLQRAQAAGRACPESRRPARCNSRRACRWVLISRNASPSRPEVPMLNLASAGIFMSL